MNNDNKMKIHYRNADALIDTFQKIYWLPFLYEIGYYIPKKIGSTIVNYFKKKVYSLYH